MIFFFFIGSILQIDRILAKNLHRPVVKKVKFKLALVVKVSEDALKVDVVGSLRKAQVATVAYIDSNLFRVPHAHRIHGGVQFTLLNLLVLFLFIFRFQTHPGQIAS